MVSKKDIFSWKEGAAPPPLPEHSQIKHQIISEYLKEYIMTLTSNVRIETLPLTIIDGFSGGGKYTDQFSDQIVNGSPFLLMNTVRETEAYINTNIRIKPVTINADYHFIDDKSDAYNFLRNEIYQSEYKEFLGSSIKLYHSSFDKAAPQIIENIRNRNRSQRAIFLLDQFAYRDVPFPIIRDIFTRINHSEVILTFSIDSLTTFLSDNHGSRSAMRNIGLEQYIDWSRLEMLNQEQFKKQAIQEQLSEAIFKASGANYITIFFCTPKKGWTYWLVHLSKTYRARSVMMDVHWNVANTQSVFKSVLGDGLFSLGYKAYKTPKQATLDFGEELNFTNEGRTRCIRALEEELPRLLHTMEPCRYEQLLTNIGNYTAASESEIKEALQQPMQTGEITVLNEKQNLRRSSASIKASDIIEYKQKTFFNF